jgi:hypothetical protein
MTALGTFLMNLTSLIVGGDTMITEDNRSAGDVLAIDQQSWRTLLLRELN